MILRGTEPELEALLRALQEHAPTGRGAEARLHAVVTEAAAHPGKLVRGRLVLAAAHALAVDAATAQALATALEYFHVASLLLDDLPCMDAAMTRRGRPCAHRVYGESAAILGALAFINRAYALIGFALAGCPGATRLQAQAGLDACLGWAGLVGGQALDLAFRGSARPLREVGRVSIQKTTALLWLAALLPALAGGATATEFRALRALCLYWGLAFQGIDDLRDLLAAEADTGKSIRQDAMLARPNLGLVLGVPVARRRIRRLLRQARTQLAQLREARSGWAGLMELQLELEHAARACAVAHQEAA